MDENKYPILSGIDSPEDLKKLKKETLPQLCREVRSFLVNNISRTGGHLASSLGAVELITALHYSFSSPCDRMVFDVGHQAYAHKIYTGRRDGFSGLRQLEGMSGFPRPDENIHDAFIAGHGSNSISAALGLARAMRISGSEGRAIAVIGDGAMTGGLAYEGLNDAGAERIPLIVVLNDNGMSIDPSVGGLSKSLTRLRVKGRYRDAKAVYHRIVDTVPGGHALNKVLGSIRDGVKYAIIPNTFFEDMGCEYIGPVDGHDINEMLRIFDQVRNYDRPVVIHVITRKGRGYSFSEEEPSKFHGVGKFDVRTGRQEKGTGKSCSEVFGRTLCDMAENDSRIAAITAAMPSGAGLCDFRRRFPKRYFDVGIAEEHAVTMAGGMAQGGIRPFVAIYSTFLQRAFDEIMHDCGVMGLPVVFCVDRAGLVGEDGETHQGLYDIGMLRQVPGMEIYAPSSESELETMVRRAGSAVCPTAIRYPRGGLNGVGDYSDLTSVCMREGGDITLCGHGRTVETLLEAAKLLCAEGIAAGVVKINRLFPLDIETLEPMLGDTVLVCEETSDAGSVGIDLAAQSKKTVVRQNCGNRFVPHATVSQQLEACGLTAEAIALRAKELYRGKSR